MPLGAGSGEVVGLVSGAWPLLRINGGYNGAQEYFGQECAVTVQDVGRVLGVPHPP